MAGTVFFPAARYNVVLCVNQMRGRPTDPIAEGGTPAAISTTEQMS